MTFNKVLGKKILKVKSSIKKTKKKTSETAGLDDILHIGENSRVMLKRNLDVSKGLCNGRLGYVKKLIMSQSNCLIELQILFDGDLTETKITKVTSQYEIYKNIYATRKQFPVTLAWAITIHKSQGLSLDGILADLGSSVFDSGMAYVALSRARSMKNVYLIDFDPVCLKCNSKAVVEYNRLRKEFKPNLPQISEWNNQLEKAKANNSNLFNSLLSQSAKNTHLIEESKREESKIPKKRKIPLSNNQISEKR